MEYSQYLNSADCKLARITKADKDFDEKLDFKGVQFPVKIRDIQKTEKEILSALVFLAMKKKKNIQFMYQKQCCEEKHVDLLLLGGQRNFVLIKDFNSCMYDHTLHHGRKHFCRYCLQVSSTEEILKRNIKDCFKINCKQQIIMPKEGEFVKLKNYERKIQSSFITYADFEGILVPENNGS